MIVEPDFLDHWKTRLLVRLLNTETAPLYVIRIWAHCQSRKTHRFTGWNPDVLASVCRWVSDSQTLWDAMGKTFLVIEGDTVTAHDWDNVNASLISSWENGKKGGRPKASQSTPPKPKENPPVNPPKTDRVSDREDREEKIEKTTTPDKPANEPTHKGKKPRKERKPVERNPVLDALVESCGGEIATTTRSAWVQAATALRDIKEVSPEVTPDDIKAKAAAYRKAHPEWDLTPLALSKHWGSLSERKQGSFLDGLDWRQAL